MSKHAGSNAVEKTVLVVFPSIFSQNKVGILEENIAKVLKAKGESFPRIRRDENLVIVEVPDPVLVSATLVSLFGIERIAIAREIENKFALALETIASTGRNLLLRGDRFYVKVEGRSSDYLAKDLEVAATASLIEKSSDLDVHPGSESSHTRLLYTYITNSHAYVCAFVDRGLGGIPYNSQGERMVCCIYDELSAVSCLQAIKMGFDVIMVTVYSNDSDLLRASKMINRMLLSVVGPKVTLYFCKAQKMQDLRTRILVGAQIATLVAKSKGIRHVGLPVPPFAFPARFIEETSCLVSKKGLVPWLPLAGMDSSLIENAGQLGLEKFLTSLGELCNTKLGKKAIPQKSVDSRAADTVKNLRQVSITIGSKNLYDMIDSLRTNH